MFEALLGVLIVLFGIMVASFAAVTIVKGFIVIAIFIAVLGVVIISMGAIFVVKAIQNLM